MMQTGVCLKRIAPRRCEPSEAISFSSKDCFVTKPVLSPSISLVVRAFGDNPQSLDTWVLYFSYVWVPVVLVTARDFRSRDYYT
jgi:hypothetical protein